MSRTASDVTLGRRIKSRRALKNWTQVDLASVAGVSSATVALIEQERVDPTTGTLTKLARALETSLDWLVYGDEPAHAA